MKKRGKGFKEFRDEIFPAVSKQQGDKILLMICLEINKSGIWNPEHNATFSLQEASTLHFTYVMSFLAMQIPRSSKARLRSHEYPLGNDCLK